MAIIRVMGHEYTKIINEEKDGIHSVKKVRDITIREFEETPNGLIMLNPDGSRGFRYAKSILEEYGWIELDVFQR